MNRISESFPNLFILKMRLEQEYLYWRYKKNPTIGAQIDMQIPPPTTATDRSFWTFLDFCSFFLYLKRYI
jgi:hypothetical protein